MILRPVAPPVEYGITKRLARAGNAAIAFLRSLGTSAHVWLPGANGVSVASLPSNNYLLSDFATYSGVDDVVGGVKDAMNPSGGISLTQATTANKPLVRRGMLNELLNSATPATQSVTCIAAPYTLALYGTGNVVLSGTGAGTLTGTGASDLVVLNFTPTAGSVTFTKAGTVSSFGLFKGTWTAAQILAEGGIPTTTATAASNPSAGKYWWSFDGSNDSLLSTNLGITNAVTITVAGMVNSLAAAQIIFAENTNGVQVSIATTGEVSLTKVGGAALVTTAAGVVVAGVPFVLTARLLSGNADIRKNGAQSATAASGLTFSAITGARVGTAFDGTTQPLNGSLSYVSAITQGLTDAQCLLEERLAASMLPNASTIADDALALLLEDSGYLLMEDDNYLLME